AACRGRRCPRVRRRCRSGNGESRGIGHCSGMAGPVSGGVAPRDPGAARESANHPFQKAPGAARRTGSRLKRGGRCLAATPLGRRTMSKVIIWNVVIGIVLGSVYGVTLRIVFGAGGAGRTALKTVGVVVLTAATTPYVAPAL